jgi:type II secretory pathway pseudopilin PulG
MKRALWLLRRMGTRLGWAGLLGLLLLAGSGLYYFTTLRANEARLQQAEQQAASLRTRIQQAARGGITLTGSAAQLAEFYGFFAGHAATDWLDKIYAAAARHSLTLEQGEYRTLPDKTGKLIRYQLTLPVKGSYVQMREFIDTVLTDVPVAALEDVGFKRESIGATTLEARIKFTLFLGAQ